jgi:hypothetical protein
MGIDGAYQDSGENQACTVCAIDIIFPVNKKPGTGRKPVTISNVYGNMPMAVVQHFSLENQRCTF